MDGSMVYPIPPPCGQTWNCRENKLGPKHILKPNQHYPVKGLRLEGRTNHQQPSSSPTPTTLTAPLSYLIVLFDDVLRRQRVVLEVAGQVEHVLGQLLLQVVVVLQDRLQLGGRLTLIQGNASAHRHTNDNIQTSEYLKKTTP